MVQFCSRSTEVSYYLYPNGSLIINRSTSFNLYVGDIERSAAALQVNEACGPSVPYFIPPSALNLLLLRLKPLRCAHCHHGDAVQQDNAVCADSQIRERLHDVAGHPALLAPSALIGVGVVPKEVARIANHKIHAEGISTQPQALRERQQSDARWRLLWARRIWTSGIRRHGRPALRYLPMRHGRFVEPVAALSCRFEQKCH